MSRESEIYEAIGRLACERAGVYVGALGLDPADEAKSVMGAFHESAKLEGWEECAQRAIDAVRDALEGALDGGP